MVMEMRERIVVARTSGRADTAEQGSRLYDALCNALARRDVIVELDFQSITTATSSFANLAFVQLLTRWPLAELKHRLRVVNSTRQINEMIKSRLEREGNSGKAVA
ncbi:STAS-like domain-containing protein [Bradyrhizobium septentrionale]|uniref:STAS-like domain-containing protein n=1 Tax=Bradyrhizobium septentrionale TaxID=1404411 RepID=A0A974A589_9BRAD|nr:MULTISPECIES: STAS-like domain-containing protein [Bradyrhizobium]MCK7666184.1 STAS-like domain-containing protein [Bradyrhizobium sp. 2S1]UGY16824.1 STAS-like domain-containing protein [Bradyrhizobium septentrionale]